MLEDQTSRKAKLAGMVEVAENLKSNSRLPGKRSEMGFCEVWGSVSLFSVASLTFFFSPPSSWPCLHQVRTREMKREMGRSEELEDPLVYWKPLFFSPVAGDKARAARVSSM